MSKAYYCRIADGLAEVLELWASKEGTKPTTLATTVLEQGLRQSMADGIAPSFEEVERKKKQEAEQQERSQ